MHLARFAIAIITWAPTLRWKVKLFCQLPFWSICTQKMYLQNKEMWLLGYRALGAWAKLTGAWCRKGWSCSALWAGQWWMHSAHKTLFLHTGNYTTQSTHKTHSTHKIMYTEYCPVYTANFAPHNAHWIIHCAMNTKCCALYTVNCRLHTSHNTTQRCQLQFYTSHRQLCYSHFTQHLLIFQLKTPDFTLHTAHYPFNAVNCKLHFSELLSSLWVKINRTSHYANQSTMMGVCVHCKTLTFRIRHANCLLHCLWKTSSCRHNECLLPKCI